MVTYAATARGYRNLWAAATLQSAKKSEAERVARRIIANRARYEAVATRTGHPQIWPLIGALHDREAGGSFSGVLHNGEHIIGTGRRTSLVPAGRGPFSTWENAAVDALTMPGKRWQDIKEWPIERWLYQAEAFNGFGYVSRGVNSPYVWAGTSKQQRGKYVADHVWGSSAWDTQLGIASVLKALFSTDPSLSPRSPSLPAPVVVGGTASIPVVAGSVATGDPAYAVGAAIAVAVIFVSYVLKEGSPMLGINWKTNLAAIGVALGTAGTVLTQVGTGTFTLDANTLGALAAAVSAVWGLFSAKDSNVTGGSVRQ